MIGSLEMIVVRSNPFIRLGKKDEETGVKGLLASAD